MATADEILRFWFEETPESAWFEKDDAFDDRCAARFGALLEEAAAGGLSAWEATRDGRLALILLLDQFSRNIFRGTPRAFAQDARALDLARRAVALGDHVSSSPQRCLFLFLPFEHSEDLADQRMCGALYRALGNDYWTGFADQHRVIIERFGRFPHRNAILGRDSSAEEIAFLQEPNSSF